MASSPDLTKGEGLIRTYDLLEHLVEDVYRSFEILDANQNSQYLRRVTVRNVFSFIEGIIQILKYEIKSDLKFGYYDIKLSKNENEVLFETKERNGEKIPFFMPIEINLKKTFSLASKVWALNNFTFETNCDGYTFFTKAKETRNRLTHPRTYYDIDITDREMGYVTHAFEFVRSEFMNIMKENTKNIASELPQDIADKILNVYKKE